MLFRSCHSITAFQPTRRPLISALLVATAFSPNASAAAPTPGQLAALRDLRVETDVPVTGYEEFGEYGPLREGSRIYVSTPAGDRVGFTFAPREVAGRGFSYYLPEWVADDGVTWQLESVSTPLARASGRFYVLDDSKPYNPAAFASERAQYTLVAADGTRYELRANDGVTAIEFTDGVRLFVSDSGIVGPGNEAVQFRQDAGGRITRVIGTDGSTWEYSYDAAGNLAGVRNLVAGTSNRFAYADPSTHRLTLAIAPTGGVAIEYGEAAVRDYPVTELGGALAYLARDTTATFTGDTQRYSVAVRPSETTLPAGGAFLLGVVVEAEPGSAFVPDVPAIDGFAAIASGSDGTRAFALFRVDRAGLDLLRVNGSGTGGYRLQLFAAGDIDGDTRVDGTDAELIAAARGTRAGDAGYLPAADIDRDGDVDAADAQIVYANLGFAPNQAPVVGAGSGFTHVDLDAKVPVASFVTDPDRKSTRLNSSHT